MEETIPSDNLTDEEASENNSPSRDNMQIPGAGFNSSMSDMENAVSNSTNLVLLFVSVIILLIGLIIAKLYKY